MRERGIVRSVTVDPAGDELEVAATAGQFTIQVTDTADFYQPNVDTALTIGSETISYSAVDPDTDIITLDTALANNYSIGEPVYLGATTVTAMVDILTGGSYDCIVPSSIIDMLDGNVYDLTGATVTVDDADDDLYEDPVVLWIDDQLPVRSAEYIDPDTIGNLRSDGNPPSAAPSDLEVRGFPRSLLLKHSGVVSPDPITYRYHITTDPATVASDATVAPGNEAVASTFAEVDALPDGSALLPDTDYWVAAESRDEDVPVGTMGPVTAWVVGQLNPNGKDEIAAASISGIHMEAAFLVAGEILTALTGRRGRFSNEGFFMYEQDNSALLAFPNTGDAFTIAADLVAKSLTALGGIDMLGTSQLRAGSTLIMQSAWAAPTSPPGLEITWPSQELDADVMPSLKRGLWRDGSNWAFCVMGTGAAPVSTITIVSAVGAPVSTNNLPTGFIADGGLCKIGTSWYVLGIDNSTGQRQVRIFNSSFVQTGSWNYTNTTGGKQPAIGTDGTDIIIAQTTSSGGTVKIKSFNASTGAAGAVNVTSSNAPANRDMSAVINVASGAATALGLGGARYVVAFRGTTTTDRTIYCYDTSGTQQTNENWPVANDALLAGLYHDGTDFFHLSDPGATGLGKLAQYLTSNRWTTESSKWWVAYTPYDSVGTVHESGRSSRTSITMKKRARLVITMPTLQTPVGSDDPTEYRIWVGRGSSDPATSALWLQSGNVTTSPWQKNLDAAVFSGTPFSTGKAADFPSSNPAQITTSDGTVLFRAGGLPRLRLTKGSVSSGSGTGGTAIGWDTEDIDSDNWWDSGTPSVIDPTYACHALVAVDTIWAVNGTNLRALWIEESSNGGSTWSTVVALQSYEGALNNEPTIPRFAQMVPLAAGNIYRVMRYQNSGGSLNMTSARITITPFGPQ